MYSYPYSLKATTHRDAIALSREATFGSEPLMDWSKAGAGAVINELRSRLKPLPFFAILACEVILFVAIKVAFFMDKTPPWLAAVALVTLGINAAIVGWALAHEAPQTVSNIVYDTSAACRGIRAAQAEGLITRDEAKELLASAMATWGRHFRSDIAPLPHMMLPRLASGGLATVARKGRYLTVTYGERSLGLTPGDSGGESFAYIEVVSPCCGSWCKLSRGAQICARCRSHTLLPVGQWVGEGSYDKLLGEYLGLDIMAQAMARSEIEAIFEKIWVSKPQYQLAAWAF